MTLGDKKLQKALEGEQQRQLEGLELIPSENYVSPRVLRALGSVFTNKYSEGYPGKRYYGGQTFTDQIEQIAIDKAKELFGSDHANVQPHSGAPANEAVYFAWLEPGDTVLGMDLSHGGHLTHGHPMTMMSKVFDFQRYGLKDIATGGVDFDQVYAQAKKHQPKIILAGFSSYPRELDYQKFAEIAEEVGAVAMADVAHIAGLIAAGALANPFDFDFDVVTATTHKTMRGPRGGLILSQGTVGNPLKSVEKTKDNLPTLIDRAVFPGLQGGPHMNNVLAKAVAFHEAAQPEYQEHAQNVLDNAQRLAEELQSRGFKLVTDGTDNHLLLLDIVSSHDVSGKEAEAVFDKIGLTTNKNVIPDDERPAYDPSGVRLGTPAATTRGMREEHMTQLAEWMEAALKHRDNQSKLENLRQQVKQLCLEFPPPSIER